MRRLTGKPDPILKTVRFGDLVAPRPECQLLGVGYEGLDWPPTLGGRTW